VRDAREEKLLKGVADLLAGIVQRKRAEDEVEHSREHLQELVTDRTRDLESVHQELLQATRLASLGQVAGSVAHEIRNPLGVIRNSIFFLNTTVRDKLEGKPARHLQIMDEEIDKANAIITSLLDFAKGEAPERKPSRLALIIAEALSQAGMPASVGVSQSVPSDLPWVQVDPRQMVQVFRNLLSNADQAMAGKGRISITAEPFGDYVRVSVADNGPGIKPEHLDRVFEPLFSTKVVGVGLGLTICRSYLEANQGAIQVRSEVGRGTTVIVDLPAAKPEPAG
jgi:signal transduction histidine kinase